MSQQKLADVLWRIYRRPDPPIPWELDGNLPWNEPAFSERMLEEHLDQSHSAASRTDIERQLVTDWLWDQLGLSAGMHILDFTCGPGLYAVELALRGCQVTGIDFSPASIAYARALAAEKGVADRCRFVEQDVRQAALPLDTYDAALFLYGQLAVFRREQAFDLLEKLAAALKPGAPLVVELLKQERLDKKHSTWWFTDDKGLWGRSPFLHLGERYWLADEQLSIERFYIIDLTSHEVLTVNLCDQSYTEDEAVDMLRKAGLGQVRVVGGWDDLEVYDREEWVVYIANK